MAYKDVTPPAGGKISIQGGKLTVPENPIIPFIRGDGTGPDIWAASVRIMDSSAICSPCGLRLGFVAVMRGRLIHAVRPATTRRRKEKPRRGAGVQ